jgi:hypothetical protein
MKRIRLLSALLLLAALASCDCDCSTYARVTTEDGGSGLQVTAELRGEGARIEAAGDKLELRDGQAWVNGQSYGTIGADETIHYRVENTQRTLRVGDAVRTAAAGG